MAQEFAKEESTELVAVVIKDSFLALFLSTGPKVVSWFTPVFFCAPLAEGWEEMGALGVPS